MKKNKAKEPSQLASEEKEAQQVLDAAMLSVFPQLADIIDTPGTSAESRPAFDDVAKALQAWNHVRSTEGTKGRHDINSLYTQIRNQLRQLRKKAETNGLTSFQEVDGKFFVDARKDLEAVVAQHTTIPAAPDALVVDEICAELLGASQRYLEAKRRHTVRNRNVEGRA